MILIDCIEDLLNCSGIFIPDFSDHKYPFVCEDGNWNLVGIDDPKINQNFIDEIDCLPGDECESWYEDEEADFGWDTKPDILWFHGYVGEFLRMKVSGKYDIGKGRVISPVSLDSRLIAWRSIAEDFLSVELKKLYELDSENISISSLEPDPENNSKYIFVGHLGKKAPLEFSGTFDIDSFTVDTDLFEPDCSKHVFAYEHLDEIADMIRNMLP